MTARRDSMPGISSSEARWDADAGKVRYFACFEGADDEWVEVPAEDFDRITRMRAHEAIDFVCAAVSSTLDHVNAAMEEIMAFRQVMESMVPRATGTSEEN